MTKRGIVAASHGIRATVLVADGSGTRIRCRPPADRTRPAVGDRVVIDKSRRGGWYIAELAERERCLWRPQLKGRQLMAAHVDRLVIMGAVEPWLKPGVIDRFLVAAELEDIDSLLVVNKCDLPKAAATWAKMERYEGLGYYLIPMSVKKHEGVDELRALLSEGVTVIVGHSGVGKSTLLNRLLPDAELTTGELSRSTGKGKHTTSVATAHELGAHWPNGALLIDTPGVRQFGLHGVPLESIGACFRELDRYAGDCHFRNCLHEEEPGCAVVAALEEGAFAIERYESYLRIVASVRDGFG